MIFTKIRKMKAHIADLETKRYNCIQPVRYAVHVPHEAAVSLGGIAEIRPRFLHLRHSRVKSQFQRPVLLA